MSKENLDQFIQKVTDSKELQARIGEEIDADSLIALGVEHGCEFSAEDLAAEAELSDEELDGVAGGLARSQVLFKTLRGVQSANGDFRPPDHPGGPGRKLLGNPLGFREADGSDA